MTLQTNPRRLSVRTPNLTAVSGLWRRASMKRASGGKLPRVRGTPREIELKQLCLAISRGGLVFIAELLDAKPKAATPLIHALEWGARHAGAGVAILCPSLPEPIPPFDRILNNARQVLDKAFAACIDPPSLS